LGSPFALSWKKIVRAPMSVKARSGRWAACSAYTGLVEGEFDGLVKSLPLQLKSQRFLLPEYGTDHATIALALQHDLPLQRLVGISQIV